MLQDLLDLLSTPDISVNERKTKADQALSNITKLSAELADASGDLPSYDQRSYNLAVKELHDKLVITQASHAPKTRFSFKNKRHATPASQITSATTSGSLNPSHLRDPGDALNRNLAAPAVVSLPMQPLSGRELNQDPREKQSLAESLATAEPRRLTVKAASGSYLRHPSPSRDFDQMGLEDGQSCVISDVKCSVVNLTPLPGTDTVKVPSLTVASMSCSLLLAPDIKGPAHMTGLSGSTVVLSCQQFRMHNSHDMDVYLHCSSRPIVEDCSNIRFGSLPDLFAANSETMNTRKNMFDQVDDFKWLRAEPSPNWRLMKEHERIKDTTWRMILDTLAAQDKRLEEGLETNTADVLRVFRHSEAEKVS